MSGVDQIRAAFRAARDLVCLPVKWNSKGARFKCLTKFLLDLGWSIEGPWIFSHDDLNFTLCLHPLRPEFIPDQGPLDHMLRESWRSHLYNQCVTLPALVLQQGNCPFVLTFVIS